VASVDLTDCSLQAALGAAELALRLVDRHDQVITLRSDEGLRQRSDALAIPADVVCDGRQFR